MSEKHLVKGFKLPTNISVDSHQENQNQATFTLEPFERGFGTTIGNSLRRVLLSSIQGFSATAVKITVFDKSGGQRSISSEFETIDGVQEDTIDIFDAIKKIRFVVDDSELAQINVSGECKGKQAFNCGIFAKNGISVLNPEDVLFTSTSDVDMLIELELELGRGYLPAEETEKRIEEADVIPIDALFSPVNNVYFNVTSVRIRNRSDFEKLIITIETDGRISACDAMSHGAKILKEVVQPLINFDESLVEMDEQESRVDKELEKKISLSVGELELSQRSGNCLKAAGIFTLRDLIKLTEKDIEGLPNFGKKSMDEVKEKLKEMDISLGMLGD